MHPNLARLIPVDILFVSRQQIDQQRISRLLAAAEEDLARMEFEEAEEAGFLQTIVQEGTILEARVTERVRAQYDELCHRDKNAARRVRDCLERMQSTAHLRSVEIDTVSYRPPKSAKSSKPAKSDTVDVHLFKSFETSVRPVFYTRPKDIYTAWEDEVKIVVMCELETGEDGNC